jgi:hypothetical protein
MQATTIPRAVAATAVIVAGGLVLLARAPSDEPTVAPSREPLTIAVNDAPAPRADAPVAPNDAQAAAAKVRELAEMSETFRNTTFVIAIRDAGYVCNELLRVYGGIDDSGKWTATCSEMLAYTLAVTGNGALHVEPMMQYFDAPGGAPIRNDQTVPQLPPQQLPER